MSMDVADYHLLVGASAGFYRHFNSNISLSPVELGQLWLQDGQTFSWMIWWFSTAKVHAPNCLDRTGGSTRDFVSHLPSRQLPGVCPNLQFILQACVQNFFWTARAGRFWTRPCLGLWTPMGDCLDRVRPWYQILGVLRSWIKPLYSLNWDL
jgi:hypothetical protein